MSSNNRIKRDNRKFKDVVNSVSPEADNDIQIEFKRPATKPIETLTQNQGYHKDAMIHDTMCVAIGPAGSGKTYLAAAMAAELYMQNSSIKKILMTRPNVEVGKSLGFLPGDLNEKFAPYLEPFKKGLVDRLGSDKFKCDFSKGRIKATPLQYMRGETYDDCIMLLDEAQNTTVEEMKMFITRVGINTKVFITGDINQTDLRTNETGLAWLVRRLREKQKPYEIIQYTKADCVRSGFCLDILDIVED